MYFIFILLLQFFREKCQKRLALKLNRYRDGDRRSKEDNKFSILRVMQLDQKLIAVPIYYRQTLLSQISQMLYSKASLIYFLISYILIKICLCICGSLKSIRI